MSDIRRPSKAVDDEAKRIGTLEGKAMIAFLLHRLTLEQCEVAMDLIERLNELIEGSEAQTLAGRYLLKYLPATFALHKSGFRL